MPGFVAYSRYPTPSVYNASGTMILVASVQAPMLDCTCLSLVAQPRKLPTPTENKVHEQDDSHGLPSEAQVLTASSNILIVGNCCSPFL